MKSKNCPTKRAPDVWDSARFTSIFLASSFFYSQALSTPAHTQVTQTVGLLKDKKTMNNDPFQRSHGIVWGAVALFASVPIAFIWLTVGSATPVQDLSSLLFVGIFLGGILLLFAYLCSLPIIQLMTKYTDEGVAQPSLFGSKFLLWQDVQEIRNITSGEMVLIGSDTRININLNLFRDPHAVLSKIRSRIPEYAYPSEAQIQEEMRRRKQNDAARSAVGAFLFIVVIIVIGKNVFAVVFGLLMAAYMIYEIRKWLKYRSLQS